MKENIYLEHIDLRIILWVLVFQNLEPINLNELDDNYFSFANKDNMDKFME